MTEIMLIKTVGGLQPCSDDGREVFQKWKLNDMLLVNIRKPRNADHHRKFFALLNLTWENQNTYATVDELRDAILIDVGFYDTIALMNGTIHLKPRSISFASMDQTEFDQLYNPAVNSCLKLLPETASEDLEREIASF